MDETLVGQLVEATREVFETMLFMGIQPSDPVGDEPIDEQFQCSACIGMAGQISGVLSIHCHRALVEEISSTLADSEEETALIDAWAEVAGAEIRFNVRDRGPGLPADQHEAIFRPFHQVDMSLTRAVQGLGLGLAICKGIIEEHGGRIGVADAENGGCLFTFHLPLGGDE